MSSAFSIACRNSCARQVQSSAYSGQFSDNCQCKHDSPHIGCRDCLSLMTLAHLAMQTKVVPTQQLFSAISAWHRGRCTHHAVTPQALLNPALLKLGLLAMLVSVCLQTTLGQLSRHQSHRHEVPSSLWHFSATGEVALASPPLCPPSPRHNMPLHLHGSAANFKNESAAPCRRPRAADPAGCHLQPPAPRGTPRCSTSASGAPADSCTCAPGILWPIQPPQGMSRRHGAGPAQLERYVFTQKRV